MGKPNRTFLKRKGRKNRHHILAKSRKGKRTLQNLILLDENRHAAFHLLFQTKTFLEVAQLLVRTHNMKNGTKLKITKQHNGLYPIGRG